MAKEIVVPSWVNEDYTPVAKNRAKKYAIVLYPDDVRVDWRKMLQEKMWEFIVSPLHDKDLNPDGTQKKPHYHVLVGAGGNWITMNELAELGKEIVGVAKPQTCSNPKGMVRYFLHMDNPEKAQYKRSEIETYGDVDLEEYFRTTASQERQTRREIVNYILAEGVTELSDLIAYALVENELWDDYIASHTIYFSQLIRSVRYRGDKSDKVRLEAEKEELLRVVSARNEELKTLKERLRAENS